MPVNPSTALSPVISSFSKGKVPALKGESPEPNQSASPPPEEGSGVLSPISDAFKAVTSGEMDIKPKLDDGVQLIGKAFDRVKGAYTLTEEEKEHPLIIRAKATKKFAETLAALFLPGEWTGAYMVYQAIDGFINDPERVKSNTALFLVGTTLGAYGKFKPVQKAFQLFKNPIAKLAEKYKYIPATLGPAAIGWLGADDEGLIQRPEAALIGAVLGPSYVKLMPKIIERMKPISYLEKPLEDLPRWLGRKWLTASQRLDKNIQETFHLYNVGVGLGQRESLQIFDTIGVGTTKKEERVIRQFLTSGDWYERSIVKKIKIRKKGATLGGQSIEGKRIGQFFKDAEYGIKKSQKKFKRLWYENRVGKDIKFPMSDNVPVQEVPFSPKEIYRQAILSGVKKERIPELYKRALKVRKMYQEAAMRAVEQQTFGKEIVSAAKEPPLLEHAIYRANMETYFPRILKDKKMRKIFGETFEEKFSPLTYMDRIKFNRFLTRKAASIHELEMFGVLAEPAGTGSKGYYTLTKDIELAKLYRNLADSPLKSSPKKTSVFTTHVENNAQFGALANRYIKPEVKFELDMLERQVSSATKFMNKLLTPWKYGKVILSPTTHARNIISNLILADLGGLSPWRIDIYSHAFFDRINNGKYWQMTEGAFQNSSYYKEEIFKQIGPFRGRSMLDVALRLTGGGVGAWAGGHIGYDMSDENPLGGLAGAAVGGASGYQFVKHAPELYQAMEEIFKNAKFIHNVKWKGMKVEDAVADANKWLFNYGDKPSAVNAINTWIQPFGTFTYKALPRVAEAATTHPWRLIKYQLAFNAMMGNSIRQLGMTRDEWDDLHGKMSDYLKNGHQLLLPIRDKRGKIQLMDWTYIFPWGDINELQNRGWGKLLGNPYFAAPLEAFVFNRTMFGSPVYYEWDTPTDKMIKQLRHIGQSFSPSLTPGIGFNYQMLDRAFKETEDSKTKLQAIGSAFAGMKITPLDEGEVQEKSYNKETRWMGEAETQRQKNIKGGMDPEKAAEKYQADLKRIRELMGRE